MSSPFSQEGNKEWDEESDAFENEDDECEDDGGEDDDRSALKHHYREHVLFVGPDAPFEDIIIMDEYPDKNLKENKLDAANVFQILNAAFEYFVILKSVKSIRLAVKKKAWIKPRRHYR